MALRIDRRWSKSCTLKLFQCPSGSSGIRSALFLRSKVLIMWLPGVTQSHDITYLSGAPNPMTSPNYLSGVTQSHEITYLLSIWQTFGVLVPYPWDLSIHFLSPPRVLRGVIYRWWHSTPGGQWKKPTWLLLSNAQNIKMSYLYLKIPEITKIHISFPRLPSSPGPFQTLLYIIIPKDVSAWPVLHAPDTRCTWIFETCEDMII